MQITLVQSEIEQAITDYIHSQINVREGMEIKIDLSATRGADGFKATIDIVPSEAPKAAVAVVAAAKPPVAKEEPKPVATQSVAQVVEQATQQPAAQAQQPTEEQASAVAQADAGNQQAENANEAGSPAEGGDNDAGEAGTQTPAPAGKSLFAGLRKPDNSKAE